MSNLEKQEPESPAGPRRGCGWRYRRDGDTGRFLARESGRWGAGAGHSWNRCHRNDCRRSGINGEAGCRRRFRAATWAFAWTIIWAIPGTTTRAIVWTTPRVVARIAVPIPIICVVVVVAAVDVIARDIGLVNGPEAIASTYIRRNLSVSDMRCLRVMSMEWRHLQWSSGNPGQLTLHSDWETSFALGGSEEPQ